MKHYQHNRFYLEGVDILVVSPDNLRNTYNYPSASAAAAAYKGIPATDYPPPWPVQTRASARASGQRYYYTGRLCKRNHSERRLASGGACTSCHSENASRYQSRGRQERVIVRVLVYRCQVQGLRQHVEAITTTHGQQEDCANPDCRS